MKHVLSLALAATVCCIGAAAAQPRAVDHVVAVAHPANYQGTCPISVEFTGTIFVNHPTTVSYRWERSDRATGRVETVRINGGGLGVHTQWQLGHRPGVPLHGSETLHVLSPGDHYSNPAEFTLICR